MPFSLICLFVVAAYTATGADDDAGLPSLLRREVSDTEKNEQPRHKNERIERHENVKKQENNTVEMIEPHDTGAQAKLNTAKRTSSVLQQQGLSAAADAAMQSDTLDKGNDILLKQEDNDISRSNEAYGRRTNLMRMALSSVLLQPPRQSTNGDFNALVNAAMSLIVSPKMMKWSLHELKQVSTKAWPALIATDGWDTGLHRPRMYVISMARSPARRKHFAQQFKHKGFKLASGMAHWALGINGSRIPRELLPRGPENFEFSDGYLGSFLSHFMALDLHFRTCPNCSMIVLEDDVSFHPDVQNFWKLFMKSVSLDGGFNLSDPGHLHIGGDAFWAPPVAHGRFHYEGGWNSRMWGYVLTPPAVRILHHTLNNMKVIENNNGFDQRVNHPIENVRLLSPTFPLVMATATASATEALHTYVDGVSDVDDKQLRQDMCWESIEEQGPYANKKNCSCIACPLKH